MFLHTLLVGLATLLAAVIGLLMLIGTASFTDRPALFLFAGISAFCLVNSLGLLLVTRRFNAGRRTYVRAVYFVASTTLVAIFVLTALVPMGDPQIPPAAVEGQNF